jgi:uncharacterized protein (DUF1778 family)
MRWQSAPKRFETVTVARIVKRALWVYVVCTRWCTSAAQGDHHGNPIHHRAETAGRLNIRASSQQQQLIRSAAAAVDKSVTDFVLESATANAERVLADRRWFVLTDEAWADFEALLDAPATRTSKLAALLSEPTVFDPQE